MTQYHRILGENSLLIHDNEDPDMKYDKIDQQEVARQRRADIMAKKSLVPKNACHYCGHGIGRGQIWCSSSCATEYADERAAVALGVKA